MTATTKRPERLAADERRQQIVEKATELFSRLGFSRVTVRMIAEECEVSEPALYRYFESKDKIYGAVLSSLRSHLDLESLFARLESESDIQMVLDGLARFIVETYSRQTELQRLLLHSALEGHPLAKEAFGSLRQPFVEFLAGKLQRLIRAGALREVHPVITARCFVGMVMDCALGTHLWKELQGRSFDPADTIENNVPIYARGLRTTPGKTGVERPPAKSRGDGKP